MKPYFQSISSSKPNSELNNIIDLNLLLKQLEHSSKKQKGKKEQSPVNDKKSELAHKKSIESK